MSETTSSTPTSSAPAPAPAPAPSRQPSNPRGTPRPRRPGTFRGVEQSISILGTRYERDGQDFLSFQRTLLQFVVTKYSYPDDIAELVQDLVDPTPNLMSKMPTLVRLTNDAGLSGIAATDYTTEQQAIVDGLPALLTVEMKEFTKRKEALRQNKTKLYHTVWGQCTDSLKADIHGHEEHEIKSRQFDSLWLLEQLKVSSAGTDRSANAYHSYSPTAQLPRTNRWLISSKLKMHPSPMKRP